MALRFFFASSSLPTSFFQDQSYIQQENLVFAMKKELKSRYESRTHFSLIVESESMGFIHNTSMVTANTDTSSMVTANTDSLKTVVQNHSGEEFFYVDINLLPDFSEEACQEYRSVRNKGYS